MSACLSDTLANRVSEWPSGAGGGRAELRSFPGHQISGVKRSLMRVMQGGSEAPVVYYPTDEAC